MPRRHILAERQRSALLDLPTDELSLLKHYTLGDDDLANIQERRRPENRLGSPCSFVHYAIRARAGSGRNDSA
jgi:TnpA family transposase